MIMCNNYMDDVRLFIVITLMTVIKLSHINMTMIMTMITGLLNTHAAMNELFNVVNVHKFRYALGTRDN